MTYRVTLTDRTTLQRITTVETDDLTHAYRVALYWRGLGVHTIIQFA